MDFLAQFILYTTLEVLANEIPQPKPPIDAQVTVEATSNNQVSARAIASEVQQRTVSSSEAQ